jgi:hypothetical protein
MKTQIVIAGLDPAILGRPGDARIKSGMTLED